MRMLGTLLKVGMGLAAGLVLTPETRRKVSDAARGVAKDYGDLARREANDLRRFWHEELEPILTGEEPLRTNGPKPPEASA
ncbi:MAG: hypothetical protein Q7S02_04645 [bacterium]|nr:hypothetical protein [bacterium]